MAAAVRDHNGHPVAGVACTFPSDAVHAATAASTAAAVHQTALALSRRISGHGK